MFQSSKSLLYSSGDKLTQMKHIVNKFQCMWLHLKPTRGSEKALSTAIIFARAGT